MPSEKFEKLISIKIDDNSLSQLEENLKEVSSEIENIKKNEVSLNNSLEQQEKILNDLNALDTKRNEILKQKAQLQEASLTATEKQIIAEEEAAKAAKEAEKAEEDKRKAAEKAEKARDKAAKAEEKATKEVAKIAREVAKERENREKEAEKLEEERSKKAQVNAEKLFKASEAIGGGFQIAASASLLFGNKTGEALEKAQAKVVALIGATDGIKKITEGVREGYDLVSKSIGKSSLASKLFGTTTKAAITATGIGALVILLGVIITNFDKISKTVKDAFGNTPIGKFISEVTKLYDSIGGLAGIFTILTGSAKNFFTLIGDILSGQGISKSVEKFLDAQSKLVDKAKDDEARRVLIKSEELAIKVKQQEIDILKARNKETLQLEKELIEAKIKLNKAKMVDLEKDSDEQKALQEELNKNLVELEANKTAILLKEYEKRDKEMKKIFNESSIELIKDLENRIITQEQYESKSLDMQQLFLEDQVTLLKQKGEDASAVLLQIEQLKLNRLKMNETKNLNQLKDSYTEQQILLQNSLANNLITQKEFDDKNLLNQENFILEQLERAKAGSKEYLDLEKSLSDLRLQTKKDGLQKEYDLDIVYKELTIKENEAILNNEKKSIAAQLKANEDLKNAKLKNLQTQLDRIEFLEGKESANYKKLADEKKAIDLDYEYFYKALIEKRVQNAIAVANQSLATLQELNNFANELQKQQIDEANEKITNFEANSQILQQQLAQVNQQQNDSLTKQQELEDKLANARGANFQAYKQQLESERINVAEKQKEADYLAKQEMKNQQNIQAQKEKIERLQKEQAERQKAISITQAIVNTAVGVTNMYKVAPPPLGIALSLLVAAAGAAQIATIASQKYAKGGYLDGPSHEQGGIRGTGSFSNIEVEGGEYIINRQSTAKYLPLLNKINEEGKSGRGRRNLYADGAVLSNPSLVQNIGKENVVYVSNQPQSVEVSVKEFEAVQNRVNVIETGALF